MITDITPRLWLAGQALSLAKPEQTTSHIVKRALEIADALIAATEPLPNVTEDTVSHGDTCVYDEGECEPMSMLIGTSRALHSSREDLERAYGKGSAIMVGLERANERAAPQTEPCAPPSDDDDSDDDDDCEPSVAGMFRHETIPEFVERMGPYRGPGDYLSISYGPPPSEAEAAPKSPSVPWPVVEHSVRNPRSESWVSRALPTVESDEPIVDGLVAKATNRSNEIPPPSHAMTGIERDASSESEEVLVDTAEMLRAEKAAIEGDETWAVRDVPFTVGK